MDLILLPGNSPHNRSWIELVSQTLSPLFNTTQIHYYNHWHQDGNFKFKAETQKLTQTAAKLDKYAIFAKSVGVYLAAKNINEGLIIPQLCIFSGTTTRTLPLFESWPIPTLFIQEANDPYGPYERLHDSLKQKSLKHYQLNMIPGNRHRYDQINLIYDFSKSFLKRLN